jgi:ATP-binding protein involved in chromosome partitioning
VPKPLPNVGRIILAASCQGGVGKSTVALNTAISLSKAGPRVGLMDADVFRPSIPRISATSLSFLASDAKSNFHPIDQHGVVTVSLGHACDANHALLWRGPIVSQVISLFMRKAVWPKLDFLVVDTPPGTGDVHFALARLFPVNGAILVTTPQLVSVADVTRSVDAFKQFGVPVLSIVQNFGSFVCSGCHTETPIFPGNGGEVISKRFNIPLLGTLPIDTDIAEAGDRASQSSSGSLTRSAQRCLQASRAQSCRCMRL